MANEELRKKFAAKTNPMRIEPAKGTKIKKIIGIVSGKGGVGKSFVTGLSACAMNKEGFKTAIMDADITGPSIPKMFGVSAVKAVDEDGLIIPASSKEGIEIMSLNLLMQNETDPVIWRGPVIAGVVKQFYSEVAWGDVDYMFVDMPPGTGDVPLTVFQSLPVDGIIVVSTPQDLVAMIVEKALNMAKMMNIPVLGIVENMSYMKCPCCGEMISVFGDSSIDSYAASKGIDVVGKLPLNSEYAKICDKGEIESLDIEDLGSLIYKLKNMSDDTSNQ